MQATSSPEDKELLQRIRRNDTGAFHILYDRYWSLLWRIAEKKTGHTEEAKDLVQDLFIDIWDRRARLAIDGPLQTYLIAALYLKIFRHFRNKGFRETHYQHFEQFLVQTGQHVEQVHSALQQVEQELGHLTGIIATAMAQMPGQMRRVFTLKHLHQYSNQEIAEELQISVHTVKNHLKDGIRRMRKAGEESPYYSILVLLTFIDQV